MRHMSEAPEVDPVNVLLVDDNEAVRLIMRIVLSVESEIGEVREAADGAAAVEICSDWRPDVVLLDFWMPEMDGSAAAVGIKERCPEARIVAYSAVLDRKPEWADQFFVKDDIPDPEYLIELARGLYDAPAA
ncbi:MAG: response regulator transcription factor [Actinomycetota bacterium]